MVVVNNDHQAVLKKGKQFMPAVETATILRSIWYVDHVYISIDKDRTVRETIHL